MEVFDIYSKDIASLLIYVSVFVGLASHFKPIWFLRQYFGFILVLLIGLSSGLAILGGFAVWFLALVLSLQAYRVFSYLRVVKNRINPEELWVKSIRSEVALGVFLSFAMAMYSVWLHTYSYKYLLGVLSVLQFAAAVVYLLHFNRSIKDSAIGSNSTNHPDDLPSISVLIPARNETYDLTDCLQSIVASNYPKMEVLVYDDCSQDSTSDIIKHFAHAGVRFVEGKVPPDSWIPKNFAYDCLLSEADGKYVLFCGTDVRFDKNSINALVEQLILGKKEMISVLPTRNGLEGIHQVLQPMRYWRELVIPQMFRSTPPTLSTMWIADKKRIIKFGGFKAFKKSIRPEKHFSKRFHITGKYSFLRSSSGLGISSHKGYKAQINTAIRTRYPEYQKRPESVFVGTSWDFFVFLLPLPLALIQLLLGHVYHAMFSLVAAVILLFVCYRLDHFTNGQGSWTKVVIFPISVISEIIVTNYSMWAYEFDEVIWKGRNICLPVLKNYPSLPKIT